MILFSVLLRAIILMSQWLSHFFWAVWAEKGIAIFQLLIGHFLQFKVFGRWIWVISDTITDSWVSIMSHFSVTLVFTKTHVWQPRSNLVIKCLLMGHFSLFQVHRYCYLDSWDNNRKYQQCKNQLLQSFYFHVIMTIKWTFLHQLWCHSESISDDKTWGIVLVSVF